jgi:hypothetical protein
MINLRIFNPKKESDLISFHRRNDWFELEDETKCAIVGQGSAGRVYWNLEKIQKMNPYATLFVSGPATKILSEIDWSFYSMKTSKVPSIGKTEIIHAIDKYYETECKNL